MPMKPKRRKQPQNNPLDSEADSFFPQKSTPTDPSDPFATQPLERLQVFAYLIPVIGFFPSLWTLYRRTGSPQQRNAARLAVTLAFCWLSGYLFLETGARTTEFMRLPLLLVSSSLSSGYFLATIWLMLQVWQRQPLRLPGISRLAKKVIDRRLL